MILKMAAPWKDPKTGILYLRQRTPKDLLILMRGQKLSLPVGDTRQQVTIGDIVQLSLRTRDPRVGKERYAAADAALKERWKQARAKPIHPPPTELADDQSPSAEPSIGWSDAVSRFGPAAKAVLLEHGVSATDANQALVVANTASIMDAAWKRLQLRRPSSAPASAPFSEHEADRPVERPSSGLRGYTRSIISVSELFSRWSSYQKDKVAESTIRRYSASLASLAVYLGDRDIRAITGDDVYAWAEHRRDQDEIKPRVINRNDLVAVSSVFGWAIKRQGGKLLHTNPVQGIRLDEPRGNATRERTFREAEVRAILGAALTVEPSQSDPTAARAKRWCPWLAAYSGARIAELTSLTVEDFRQEEGIWVMHFRQTKTQEPRTVPLHEHIVAQGFLDILGEVKFGPIFYDPSRHRETAKFGPAELRAQKIAGWVRKVAELDRDLDPNHGWRHTFKTRAVGKIEQRVSDAITGHGPGAVARRYEKPTITQMAEALANFPRYEVGGASHN